MKDKKFITVILILILVAVFGFRLYLPEISESGNIIRVSNFPKQIGEWSSTEIQLSKLDYEILETTNLFVRDYKNDKGESIYLYIVYSQDNRKVSHPPEICLVGGGMTIIEKQPIQLSPSIQATKMIVERGDLREMVIYWYKAGTLHTDKYLKQQLKMVIDRISRKKTSNALIRLSTRIIKENKEEEALSLLKGFSRQIEPLLTKYAP